MAGNTTTGYLGGLKKPRRGKSADSKSKVPGKLNTKAGIGLPKDESGSGGGGASGWLQATEKENTRVYREEYKTIVSSDGLFVLQYKELYTIDYITEHGDTVKFKYLPLIVT